MFVSNQYGRLKKVLLCKPEYVKIHPINPTTRQNLNANNPIDIEEALREHEQLVKVLQESETEIIFVQTDYKFPFQAYTRDLGVATTKGMVLGNYVLPQRQGEHRLAVNAFLKNDIPIFHLIPRGFFEGGDIQYVEPSLMAIGCAGRSNLEGARYFADQLAPVLNLDVFPVFFNHDFVHLDMVANIIGEKLAIICPEATPHAYVKLLKDRSFTFVEIPVEDISRDAANVLSIDKNRVLSFTENKSINQQLRALGLEVIEIKLTELLKIGGGPHCLTFPIEREL